MKSRRSPRALLVLLLVLPVVGAACGGGDDEPTEPAAPGTVIVTDNKFTPTEIDVAVGDTVTWKWEGNAVHNVVGPGFKSQNQKKGEFEYTFNSAGEVKYSCTLHPGMTGKVKVS